jgi:hypothetical protein
MDYSLFNRNVIRLILTAPPAKALGGVPTEQAIAITVPPAEGLGGGLTKGSSVIVTAPPA